MVPRGSSQILSSIASIHRSVAPAVVSHYNATPVIDIYGSVQGTDLGYVSAQIDKIVESAKKDLPKGSHIEVRGQVQTMKASFNGLLIGLVGAIVLVYMLDRGQFSIAARPLHHHHGVARRARRDRLDAVSDPYHRQRAGAHGSDHVHGGRDRQQRPRRSALRASAWTPATMRSRRRCRPASRACGRC